LCRVQTSLDVDTQRNYNSPVRVTWDEAKRTENLRKHGLDFLDAESVFDGYTVTLEDDRFDYGEQRFITFGVSEGRVIALVHTEQDEIIRMISMRKATRREEQSYLSAISE
jgi:uncharacterized DUF497 family protein